MTIVIGGNLVRSDLIVSEVLRTDMSPVPVTLEATLRVDASTMVAQGDVIRSGRDNLDFSIIHVTDNNNIQAVQGGRPYAVISFIAVLNAVTAISFQRKTAVIKSSASLGDIYKACGASVRVDSDFTPVNFSCFIGSAPSFAIAQLLQEEGGVVFWSGGKLKFLRLPDLMKQTPTKKMETDSTVNIESGFLERHEIPLFYSTDDTGVVIQGTPGKTRVAQYMPRQDVRTLTNMTRVLVMKKEFKSPYAPDLNAGQIFMIVDTPYVVVTAAHVVQTGTDGSGTNAYSKFWLGALQ